MRVIPPKVRARLVEAERLFDQGEYAPAAVIYEKVLAELPGQVNALLMLARAHMARPELIASSRVSAKFAGLEPLEASGRSAVALAELALAVEPDDAGAMACLGMARLRSGEIEAAADALSRAMSMGYVGSDAYTALTSAWIVLGRDDRVIALTDGIGRAELARDPSVSQNRAVALLNIGRVDDALACYEDAIAARPDDLRVRSSHLLALNYAEEMPRDAIAAKHREFGAVLRAAAPPDLGPLVRVADPERTLRVGLVSSDFRDHSVSWFVGPLLACAADARATIVCVATSPTRDDVTDRLESLARAHGGEWTQVRGASALDLARLLRDLRLDVLIELNGHTHGSRLRALSMRGAPVQATYLGYANTTGVDEIDYRIVDAMTDPQPWADGLATERLVRLPGCFLCYAPMMAGLGAIVPRAELPPSQRAPGALPSSGQPIITFGSFNSAQKVGTRTLNLWSRVLAVTPGSRLVLKSLTLGQRATADSLGARLLAAGIDPSRVTLRPPEPSRDAHLACYNDVDIALDTFPYHGTTTTCQALSMGVPVVTRAGDRHSSRVGMSLLHAAGLADLCATDDDHYVRIARDLALDPARLRDLRATLAHGFATSALCDARAFSARFAHAVRAMWRAWCHAYPDGVMTRGEERPLAAVNLDGGGAHEPP
jgi:predicted O-linked N-acetylglucosamine transferase (SPINDLY family)